VHLDWFGAACKSLGMSSLHCPFFYGAEGALQLDFRLHQLEIGLQLVDVTATLFDLGPLLISGRQRISRAVLQIQSYRAFYCA
jgi:hypothetical protein